MRQGLGQQLGLVVTTAPALASVQGHAQQHIGFQGMGRRLTIGSKPPQQNLPGQHARQFYPPLKFELFQQGSKGRAIVIDTDKSLPGGRLVQAPPAG